MRGEEGRDAVIDEARDDTDRLFGGPDRDLVEAVDGDGRDTLDCGPDKDFFDADSGDRVLRNCEVRFF